VPRVSSENVFEGNKATRSLREKSDMSQKAQSSNATGNPS
jgi:hypothetical protein